MGAYQNAKRTLAIAPSNIEGLLGQDFFSAYDVRILSEEIEFYRR